MAFKIKPRPPFNLWSLVIDQCGRNIGILRINQNIRSRKIQKYLVILIGSKFLRTWTAKAPHQLPLVETLDFQTKSHLFYDIQETENFFVSKNTKKIASHKNSFRFLKIELLTTNLKEVEIMFCESDLTNHLFFLHVCRSRLLDFELKRIKIDDMIRWVFLEVE